MRPKTEKEILSHQCTVLKLKSQAVIHANYFHVPFYKSPRLILHDQLASTKFEGHLRISVRLTSVVLISTLKVTHRSKANKHSGGLAVWQCRAMQTETTDAP